MPSADEPGTLRADIVRRWKDELYSPDTGVGVASVLVALPAGVLAAWLLDPILVYPVWFVVAVGPNLSDLPNGVRRLSRSETVGLALGLAIGHLVLLLALYYAALIGGASTGVAVAIGVLGAFVIGNASYRRLLGDRLAAE